MFRGRLPGAIAAAQAALVIACVVELVGAPVIAQLVVALGVGLAGGAVAGTVAAALAAPWSARPGGPALIALAVAASVWLVLHGVALRTVALRFHDPDLMAALLVAVSLALLAPAAIVFVLVRRGAARALARVRVGPWRVGAPWSRLRPGRRGAAIWAGATVAALAAALSPLGDDPRVQRGAIVPAATAVVRAALDRDDDGRVAVLGDGDCAEGDARRSPRGIEVAGDGIDQDCRFGDLAPAAPAAAATAAAAGTVVLLTIGGDPARLPRLGARLDRGVRFRGVALHGRLRPVAAVLLGGRLPVGDGGFAVDGLTVPQLALDAGWTTGAASTVDLDKATTAFPAKRVRHHKDGATAARKAIGLLDAERVFLWVHVGVGDKDPAKVDAALDELLGAIERRGAHRVLVVETGPDRPAKVPAGGGPEPGGPLGLLGAGAGVVEAPAGAWDVYPTLLALLGLAEPAGLVDRPPVAGRALLGEVAGPTLAGWITRERAIVVATDGAAVARHDDGARAFRVGSRSIAEDAGGGPLVALLRDALLAPRLAWQNRARAAGIVAAPPDALDGHAATIAGALEVLGCTSASRADGRLEVTLYLRGGEHLAPGDLVEVMLKSSGIRVFGVAAPLDGALPFGTWPPGAIVAHRVAFDRRFLGPDDPFVWVAVTRGRERLRVTRGEGAFGNAVPICVVER